MLIIGCSHGLHVAKKIAKLTKSSYSELQVHPFPDGETDLRFLVPVKGKKVVLVQSFYGGINDCLMEVYFAAKTAKELGARSVTLLAPYFPYFRQDTRFHPGECVSIPLVGKFMDSCLDEIFVMDPHLHREKTVKHVFKKKAHKLTANPLIVQYIKDKVKKPLIIGPDYESYRWARATAELIGCESAIMKKTRFSSRHVEVKLNKKIDVSDKTVVIVDDIISTGHTLLEAITLLRSLGVKKFTCICVHGIFAEHALRKLLKTGAKVVSCNTVPNAASVIDVSGALAAALN